VKAPPFIQSVFGILGGIGPHPEDVTAHEAHGGPPVRRRLQVERCWARAAAQLRVGDDRRRRWAANVRVGLEDSLWIGPGKLAESNAEQVRLARQVIEGLGMQVATPDEAREILSLKGGDKVAF
jgi:hypothetical protein